MNRQERRLQQKLAARGAAPPPVDTLTPLLQRMSTAYRAGQRAEALALAREAIRRAPRRADVLGFAGMMGVVNAKFLFKHIRGAVLICVTLAAILSPTTDIMNLTIYAAPMVILYIGSIGLVWLVHPRQRRKRAEKRKEKDKEDGRSL